LASVSKKTGYSLCIIAVIVMLIGTVGGSFQDEVNDIPTPNTPRVVYFSDEPMPNNPVSFLFTAKASINWDRSDIYLVIADSDKKEQCDKISPIELISPSSVECKVEDSEYEKVGIDNSTGIEWTVENGDYYVGIGTLSDEMPEDLELNVEYDVRLTLSITGYFLLILMAVCGYILIKYD